MECIDKHYTDGSKIRFIEGHTDVLRVDVFHQNGTPIDLTDDEAIFHLMEFNTRDNIWSKRCNIIYDIDAGWDKINYPFTVTIPIERQDTVGLNGHYTGHLELINHRINNSKNQSLPFQLEIIIVRNAGEYPGFKRNGGRRI